MDVIISKDIGFCLGVKRAIKLANEVVKQGMGPLYTLGPLIHNPQVIKRLSSKGIKIVDSLKDIPPGVLILRSHGVLSHLLDEARIKGFKVTDAICPRVKRVQKLAMRLKREGYRIVVIGDTHHPEVVSIVESVGDAHIIEDGDSISLMPSSKKMGILAQTTQDVKRFRDLVLLLLPKADEVRVFNTICSASFKRQKSSLDLARKVEVMIVIGGYNSANTRRIAEVCKDVVKTHHIETEEEIRQEWFNGVERIGITSGTSTPYDTILRVVERIRSIS